MLQVLVFSKLLTPDRVEPIRRTAKTKSTSVEEAIVDLGLLTDVQIADALARYAGLRFVKINPLDLDLDVVTTALSGPFARRHGLIAISKNATTLTAPGCPAAQTIPLDVERRTREIPALNDVKVEVVWDPPWTKDKMSEAAKLTLGIF